MAEHDPAEVREGWQDAREVIVHHVGGRERTTEGGDHKGQRRDVLHGLLDHAAAHQHLTKPRDLQCFRPFLAPTLWVLMGFRWFSMAFGMIWVRFALGFMGFARVAKVESLVEKTVSSRSSRKYLGGFDLDEAAGRQQGGHGGEGGIARSEVLTR